MNITRKIATAAVAALALGGAGIGTAVASSHGSARPHSASTEPTSPDPDTLQQGDQTSPDPSGGELAKAASSTRIAASHARAAASDDENGSENNESAPEDGPGGHAQPGVFMQAHPTLNRQFRQEWFQGHAEDSFKVIGFDQPVTVPAGSFHHALRTAEQTDLEPGVRDNKFYVAGIGEVVETAVHGPTERHQLVEIIS
jgi:hypothetical protein